MESLKVFVFCLVFKGVNSLVTRTFEGVAVQLDTKTHVLTLNQSQSFIFEVQSCGTVNITLLSLNQAARIDINIPKGAMNISKCFPEQDKTTLKCSSEVSDSLTAGSCLTASQFWVDVPSWTGYFIGSGCEIWNNSISTMYMSGINLGYSVLVASDEEATWNFGTDACAPPTTTTTPTTSTTTTKQGPDLICKSAGVTCFNISDQAGMWIFMFSLFMCNLYL